MKQTLLFAALSGLRFWTSCENDNPTPESEKPIFPDMTNIKIDEVYSNGNLYLRFTYNERGLPTDVEVTTDNLQMKITYIE